MTRLYALYAVTRQIYALLLLIIRRPAARGIALLMVSVLLTGMFFYHRIEGWDWIDSVYFCVVALTTVGFGGLAPKTDEGKIFTIFYIYIVLGLAITVVFLTEIRQAALEAHRDGDERDPNGGDP